VQALNYLFDTCINFGERLCSQEIYTGIKWEFYHSSICVKLRSLTMDNTDEKIYTFDQLIRQRAKDEDQTPIFAYPKTRLSVTDYELITGKKLNQLIDGAAKALIQNGLPPVVSLFRGTSSESLTRN
jgi:hypothetical protein